MHKSEVISNPFALMMNPEAVVAAMNHSDRLQRLKSRICRPLDKQANPASGTPESPSVDTDEAGDKE